jgi:hypothetical protein
MKYSWLLSISIGVLLSGCGMYESGVNVTSSIKTPQRVLMPNYRKPNPGLGSPTKRIASATPNATPYLSWNLNADGHLWYTITDYNSKEGKPHGMPGTANGATITCENKNSDLFSTTFTNPPKVKTIKFGCSKGEVQISGEQRKWVSAQNDPYDDDVVWVKKQ